MCTLTGTGTSTCTDKTRVNMPTRTYIADGYMHSHIGLVQAICLVCEAAQLRQNLPNFGRCHLKERTACCIILRAPMSVKN